MNGRQNAIIKGWVATFQPHEDFPDCYAGKCDCEQKIRERLAAFYETMHKVAQCNVVKEAPDA